ncbi:hypothetical protein Pint_11818 [Pistacia integerrima]|uniref:Uncharacterized protein n=1 Tax=Pistacia integerrima TaxID=434235 RepID=A0ACC0XH27_9ROSI|nr:hypothetical protein Pint_11818 [Pistacia integerrima]
MEERGITPSKVTYTILIDAFARSDHMEKAFQIHAFMEKAGLVPDVYTYGVLIHGLCMKGNMREASKLFKSMSEMQLEANDVVYNMMIHGYCKEDNSYRALRLLKEMDEKGLVPNVASYSSTIGVLCKNGKWQEAEEVIPWAKSNRSFSCCNGEQPWSNQLLSRRWRLLNIAESKVAELLHVHEFVIHGTFNTHNLNPGTYQVALVIKIGKRQTSTDQDADTFLNFHLNQTNGHEKDKTVDLHKYQTDKWTEIEIDDSVKISDGNDQLAQVNLTITKVGINYWTETFLIDAVVMKPAKEPAKTSG